MARNRAARRIDNVEIADAFSRVADLLELQQANPFRIRAYRNAVRTITSLARPLADMVAAGADLTALPSIGDDLAGHITELVRTGRLEGLRELEREFPPSLVELLRIEGLGPKRVRRLYDELGVRSVADLSRAIDAGRLEGVRGIGPKTVALLRRGIASLETRRGRYRLIDADRVVAPLLAWLRDCDEVEHVEAAGSLRRRRETVRDIDVLAVSARPTAVMRRFTAYPDADRIDAAGRTRGTLVLRSGMHVDLRVLPRQSRGAGLHYLTGSKAHNIAVRRLGVERGLRISEYGVFRVGAGTGRRQRTRRIGGATEEEVYAAVGLPWIPPELREDRGEIEAAREGRLPRLIEAADLRGDLQMHSTWSDGRDTLEAMVAACVERGYTYMAITDHSRSVTVAHGLGPRDIGQQAREIDALRRRYPQIRILHGMEVDILRDGSLDLPDASLARLDLVVVAVHSARTLDRERMTQRLIRAIAHPRVHILAHPTGRLIGRRAPADIDLDAVLQAAARHGVAVELNGQPDRLDLDDVQVRRARELGVPVVIDSDAHATAELAFVAAGVDQARRGWLEPGDVLNAWPAEAFEAWRTRRAGGRAGWRAAGRRSCRGAAPRGDVACPG